MLSYSDIIVEKEAQVDKLLREGTKEGVIDFIFETRLLALALNELTHKLLPIDSEPYNPKHFR